MVIFEIIDKGGAANGIELGEDIVEEDEGAKASFFIGETSLDKFESENERA